MPGLKLNPSHNLSSTIPLSYCCSLKIFVGNFPELKKSVGHFPPLGKKCGPLSIPKIFGKLPARSVGQLKVPQWI